MLDEFSVRVLLSFVVGGSWVVVATVAAERFGTRVGGIVANLPTTALVSLAFIGWGEGVEAAARASVMVPAVMGANTIFLLAYAVLLPRGFFVAILSAMGVWSALISSLVVLRLSDVFVSTLIFTVLAGFSLLVLEYSVGVQSQPFGSLRHSTGQLLSRGLFSGTAIAFAVYMAKVGGAWLGGAFSAFPAAYLSIITIFRRTYGSLVSREMAKSMVLSSSSISAFGVSVSLSLRTLGLGLAIVLGYVSSLAVGASLMILARHVRRPPAGRVRDTSPKKREFPQRYTGLAA